MNYGSEAGRTRFGSGSSNKAKKLKRKKDEFHSHKKLHLQETEPLDLEQVKARTILALDRLGHQVLSPEPGGYDLQSWMRNLNSLLDDFQEKIGPGRLPPELDERRREINASLLASPDSSAIDSEMETLLREQENARRAIEEESEKAAAKLRSLQGEHDLRERDLMAEKKKLAEMNEANQSRQFFSRFLRPGPSTAKTDARIKELESDLSRIEDEIKTVQRARAAGAGGSTESNKTVAEAKQKIESSQKRLDELRLSKQALIQLAQEREVAAMSLSEVVSKVQVVPGETEPQPAEA